MTQFLLDSGAALAIAEGRHGAPFDVLGPHPKGKDWVVTVYVPGAKKLQLLVGPKSAIPLEAFAVPGFDGFFQAVLPKLVPYRLRAISEFTEWEFDDAYRFGPVLGEMDEYLLGEGTHQRM
ncbi:MAG: 1,4-alpha-glucan branching enzyme, partial [Pseudomonadota bacterium]